MIIGQSIYNVPALTSLSEMLTFSIVEYQLKCCSVADNKVPDCHMVWSGAACCRQDHQRVAWTAARRAPVWELMDNTSSICFEPRTSLFEWFYCLILLTCTLWLAHTVKLLLALQGTVATCKARFDGLSDIKFSLQNSSDMCLPKIIKFGWHLANLLHTVKGPLFKTM